MGRSLGNIYAELTLKTDKLHDGIKKSNREIAKLEQDIDKAVEKINAKLAIIGTSLSASVTLPLTLLGKSALDTFTGFEQAMQNTFSVMSASGAEMEALRKKAEEMGATTRFSASQAADALYSLGSAGQNANQAINSLDGVLKLAGATGSDLAFTSSTIASTLSQFNLQADKSAHIADVFATAISKSQANMTKLSYSMKYVGPVASGLNIKLETATAALMKLYNTGYGGEMAGTYLRAGLQKLASGTDDFKSKLESIGLTYDDVNPKTNDFADIIDRLKEKQVDINKANELFGNIAGGAMAKLIEGGGEAIRTMDGLLQASDGVAKKMQDIQNASFANTKAELASAFEAVQITLTSNVIPAVNIFAQGLTNALKFINELPVGVQTAGTAFAGLAAAAGPLLLVAIGIKKIKQEMVQLNMVAAANPIMAWGAAIAGVAAVATGIIAHIRKEMEEAERASEKYLERANKLANEAKDAREKNNKIDALMNKYNSLKDVVKESTEHQEEYNATLKELQELIPDLIIEEDKLGNSYIANAEKAKEAQLKLLKLEKEKSEHALLVSNLSVRGGERNLDKYKKEREDLEKQSKLAEARQIAAEEKLREVQQLIDKYNNTGDNAIKNRLTTMTGGITLKAIIGNAEDSLREATKEAERYGRALSSINEKIENQEKILSDNKRLKDTINNLDKLIDSAERPVIKKTRQEHADDKWKEYQQEKARIDEEKKDANALEQDYDDVGKKIDIIRNKITALRSLSNSDIADGVGFTRTSKELNQLYAELNRLSKLQKKNKKKGSKSEKDTSYQVQIEELDKLYRNKIAKAKEYGKSTLAVEKEYQEKRITLIESFIEKEKKLKGDKALEVETRTGSDVTLQDELNKTTLLFDKFAAYNAQQKELREELKKTQDEIQKTKALLENSGDKLSAEDKQSAEEYLKTLQDKAQEFKIKLNEAKFSISEIDNTLKNVERFGQSDFKLKLIDIEEERKKIHEVIDEARKLGKIKSDEEADRQKKRADDKANSDKKKAAMDAANPYLKGAISIAQTLTNVFAKAIEDGVFDGINALEASSEIFTQVGNMVGNPIARAILEAVGSVTGIGASLIRANQKRIERESQKAREEARRFNENVQRQLREDIQKSNELIGDTASKIAKLQAGKKLNANTIFDSQALDIEKKRIDGFLSKIKELKTEATYSYTAAGTYRKKKHWYDWNTTEYTYYYTAYANYNVAQVMEKYNEAMRRKDYEAAKKWRDFAQRAINKGLKDAGIDSNNVDGVSNYLNSLDSVLAQYVKTRDMKAFKDALKEQLYNALVNKAVANTISQRIAQVFDNVEKGKMTYEEGLKKIESIGEEAGKIFDDMNKRFGLTAEQAKKEWEQVGKSISQSLTNALGDAAYNADWGSFKKSFAAEMKKAIIQAAIENAGIKKKVDAIIAGIMKDGKITGDEVTDTIGKLKDLFDNLEGNMAELSKITKSLEGGVNIKSKTSGSVIQQLSGADRDWFTEVFKEGFSKINQVIDLKESTIQHIAATQLIVNSLTYNSYNSSIYITANEQTDLRAVLTEIVQEALAG